MKYYFFVLCALTFSGCASKQVFDVVEYEKSSKPKYPAISFVLNDGYVYRDTSCSQYGCYTYRDNTDKFLEKELKNTQLFEGVEKNSPYTEYSLDIKFYEKYKGSSDTPEFSKMLLSAATLFLVPTSSDKNAEFKVLVRKKNKVIQEYLYKANYEETRSLFVDNESMDKQLMAYFVSLLMSDLDKDDLFASND